MNIHTVFALVLALLAVSACVIEPYGDREHHGRGGYYGGGGHEYARGVWRD
jgi:hypothetical protein